MKSLVDNYQHLLTLFHDLEIDTNDSENVAGVLYKMKNYSFLFGKVTIHLLERHVN